LRPLAALASSVWPPPVPAPANAHSGYARLGGGQGFPLWPRSWQAILGPIRGWLMPRCLLRPGASDHTPERGNRNKHTEHGDKRHDDFLVVGVLLQQLAVGLEFGFVLKEQFGDLVNGTGQGVDHGR